jgi:O-antigen ligase
VLRNITLVPTKSHSVIAQNRSKTPGPQPNDFWQAAFASAMGFSLGIALLKIGNPVIFNGMVDRPSGFLELVLQPWPTVWGYWLLAGTMILGVGVVRFDISRPHWLLFLPMVWLGWQFIAALKSVESRLTQETVPHFTACAVYFYLGVFGLSRVRRMSCFWPGILTAFVLVLWVGFGQHYGGLEATRRYFYEQPDWQRFPPEYLKKLSSDRVFSTLVYPNALAGAILLLLPAMLVVAWKMCARLNAITRKVLVGLLGYAASACLYWSGSKAGWLIALVLAILVLGRHRVPRKFKLSMILGLLVLGLGGFFVKYASYIEKGATSVGARFDYWRAALSTFKEHPILGTGPGAFSVPYAKIKPASAEMARLVHNDYLEQASDSGLVGFVAYGVFVLGLLGLLYRHSNLDWIKLSYPLWLGLLGWALQSSVEFPLYIPAIAWPAFAFLGFLTGTYQRDLQSTDKS